MATAKFKISDLADITSNGGTIDTVNDFLIINDGDGPETKKVLVGNLISSFGGDGSIDGDFEVVGNLNVTGGAGPDGPEIPTAGVCIADEFWIDVSGYTNAPTPGDGVFVPGYTFSDTTGDGNTGENNADTGMFWDGDDRVYLMAGNRPTGAVVVARRKRDTDGGTQGDELIPTGQGYWDEGGSNVGIGVVDPEAKMHIKGNLWVDPDRTDATSFQATGAVRAKEYFLDVNDFTNDTLIGDFRPGYTFSDRPGFESSSGEDNNDTGMFWDGDDRVSLTAANDQELGLLVVARLRPTGSDDKGDVMNRFDTESNLNRAPRVAIGGIPNPQRKLEVEGDIVAGADSNYGLCLYSPNGTLYRITVDDSGTLSTTAATLPGGWV